MDLTNRYICNFANSNKNKIIQDLINLMIAQNRHNEQRGNHKLSIPLPPSRHRIIFGHLQILHSPIISFKLFRQ